MKGYTDIEQSKKLAKILPIDSADMFHFIHEVDTVGFGYKKDAAEFYSKTKFEYIPCWSLAALLEVVKTHSIRLEIALRADKNYNIFAVYGDFVFRSFDDFPDGFDTLVDACVAMIESLHELNLL